MQCAAAEEISDHSTLTPLGEKNPDEDTLQKMMISASIDTFYHSIRDLHSVRYSLGIEYGAGLVKILQLAAKDDITDHTGKFLHKLREKKPDEDTLQNTISASPSSLSYKDSKDQLPIQSALFHHDSLRYIPFLAKEGVKHKVGGEDGRGGLLVDNPVFNRLNTLQTLGITYTCHDGGDKAHVDVMKEKTVEIRLLYHTK